MEPGGLFEDTPMAEVPLTQDVSGEGTSVGKSDGVLLVLCNLGLGCELIQLCYYLMEGRYKL